MTCADARNVNSVTCTKNESMFYHQSSHVHVDLLNSVFPYIVLYKHVG